MNRRLTALFSTPWEALGWLAICVFLLGWFLTTIPNRRYLAQIDTASKTAPGVEEFLRGIQNVKVVSVTPRLDAVRVRCEVETSDDYKALIRLVEARFSPEVKVNLLCKVTNPFARKQGVASFE